MKKIIPVLAVLGGAAALAMYKLNKDEKKKIIDLDEGLLHDDGLAENEDESIDEGPISEPQSCCCDDAKKAMKNILYDADELINNAADKVVDFAHDVKDNASNVIKDVKEVFPNLVEEEIQELKNKAKALMDEMLGEGDSHTIERPVQHSVRFETQEDATTFKNQVINRGFVVTSGDSELELMVLHITPLDDVKLIANILYIANETKANHGAYEGWTSKIAY